MVGGNDCPCLSERTALREVTYKYKDNHLRQSTITQILVWEELLLGRSCRRPPGGGTINAVCASNYYFLLLGHCQTGGHYIINVSHPSWCFWLLHTTDHKIEDRPQISVVDKRNDQMGVKDGASLIAASQLPPPPTSIIS